MEGKRNITRLALRIANNYEAAKSPLFRLQEYSIYHIVLAKLNRKKLNL